MLRTVGNENFKIQHSHTSLKAIVRLQILLRTMKTKEHVGKKIHILPSSAKCNN